MNKHWKLKAYDETCIGDIIRQTGLPPPLAGILAGRGITDPEAIDSYMYPQIHNLTSPLELPGMDIAVKRIWSAIDNNSFIIIFGDFDVDGVTSSSLLYRALVAFGADVEVYIPNRLKDGYGFTKRTLENSILDKHPNLIVTVDCGVNSKEAVEFAQSKGIDVIITDHHEPDKDVSHPLALINPKVGNNRKLDVLAGVGVAYKLSQGLKEYGSQQGNKKALEMDILEYLDIAALGTVADVVPLVDENRIIVSHGLKTMEKTSWRGVLALKNISGVRGAIDPYHVGFKMGPRINAAGRLGNAGDACRLLTTNDMQEAIKLAAILDDANVDRRQIEKDIVEEAVAMVNEYFNPEEDFSIVIANKGWHPGVVGIVASRIVDKFNRPTIVMNISDSGFVKGSCRSIEGFDLLQGLQYCSGLLEGFGGHKVAAGASLRLENYEAFRSQFNEFAKATLSDKDITPTIRFDGHIHVADINWDFHDALQRLAPFGQKNPEPIWCVRNVSTYGVKPIGENHLRYSIGQIGTDLLNVIAFGFTASDLPDGNVDVLFRLKTNSFRGETSLQLQQLDVKPSDRH